MREKHTFRSDEIAHIWANRRATYGKSPGNLSFSGDAISSYATEMARHIEFNGKNAIIINETSYSVTTSKSQGRVRQAIPSYVQKFYIGNIGRGCSLNFSGREGAVLFEYAIKQAEFYKGKASKARQRKEEHQGAQHRWLRLASEVNEFFELGHTVDEETIKRLEEIAEAAKLEEKQREQSRYEKLRGEQRPNYEQWKDGLTNTGGFMPSIFPTAFRIEGFNEDRQVVSTHGARVPLREARIALRFIQKHRESGWKTNGETFSVGGYRLVQIGKEIQIGCHHITWDEIDRIAPLIDAALVEAPEQEPLPSIKSKIALAPNACES